MTLHDYTVKSCDAIYIEDIPCILHPNIAYRYLEYTDAKQNYPEWDFPSGYKAYADQYRHFHINHPFMAYRSALNDIKSGKIILLKSLHGGKEIFSVQTRSGNLCTDLPLNLDSRLRYLIDNKISKPVYVSSSRQPKQYAQQLKQLTAKPLGACLQGIYNGNLEGYSRTAEQLGGDAPAGFQQVMDNKGSL